MSQRNDNPSEEKNPNRFQQVKEGWYDKLLKKVPLSLKTLDIIIIVCAVLLVLVLAHGYANRGYIVEFDTLGGTVVESQKLNYGDHVIVEEPPTREGYEFAGWYRDILCENPWNVETDTVDQRMTLYAGWEEKSE